MASLDHNELTLRSTTRFIAILWAILDYVIWSPKDYSTMLKEGYTGITLSACPSIHPSVHLSGCLWTESCLLCIFNNTCWILFIFITLSSTFQICVSCKGVYFFFVFFVFFKIPKFDFWGNFINLQLWLCLVVTWDPIWINSMGNHQVIVGVGVEYS